MPVNKKLQWRRSLSTLKFLHEELDYITAVSSESAAAFEAYYRKFCAEKNINISELDKQHRERLDALYGCHEIADKDAEDHPEVQPVDDTSMVIVHSESPPEQDEDYQMTADEIATHEAFSKLFKRIALILHPDKIDENLPQPETRSRVSMFRDCVKALEHKKYFILLDVAERFSITTPKNYETQTRWMKRASIELRTEIEKQKNTYNYSFAEAETDEQKEILIRKFLHQLFRMSVQ